MYFWENRYYYQYPESWRMTSLNLHPCPVCFSVNELPCGSVSLLAVFPRVTKGELFCSAYQTLFNLSVRTQPFISPAPRGKSPFNTITVGSFLKVKADVLFDAHRSPQSHSKDGVCPDINPGQRTSEVSSSCVLMGGKGHFGSLQQCVSESCCRYIYFDLTCKLILKGFRWF